jgi:8-oxo-dGTP pyrophosphatase MutT (NUDIX family)
MNQAKPSPWITLASRRVFENDWIRVRQDRVINPNGGENSYGIVQFRNRAIAIIPIDDQGHTWLVGQHRYPTDCYSWELPMGGHPVEQPAIEGAHRELLEETGLRAGCMTELMQVQLSNSVTDERGTAFVAQQLTQQAPCFDDTERLAIQRLPFDQALAMTLDGRIEDLFSIAALQQLALRRQQFGL